ncbi:DsbA family protein [Streptomyces gobiensis]|uniref:mycothiol-dependent nitroreductase Rv2466c family protein n=1 Tax=Streptomyces gobiensis TaxID=2875706 RepID=UPI001E30052A|nr:DsbA family protein [Streptomyces gobiensis]UGY92992.1 DsbA family protein [Streptomyces gobiensis]
MTGHHGERQPQRRIDFWYDPLCPWSWITSRWIIEVSKVRPVEIVWHELSLALLNSEADLPPDRRQVMDRYWGPVRVAAAARARFGPEAAASLYTAMGNRFHGPAGDITKVREASWETFRAVTVAALERIGPSVEAALRDTGLPGSLVSAMDSEAWDGDLRASRDRIPAGDGLDRQLIGVPTLSVDGHAGQFGPIFTEIPTGERAGELWDAFRVLATEGAFFELKRVAVRGEPRTVPGAPLRQEP